jgi:hypothetical protein
MLSMSRVRPAILAAAACTVLVLVSVLGWVAAARGADTEVTVQAVSVDRTAGTLTITGTGFDTKLDTTVVLGGTSHTILTETTTQIVAALPADITAGSYLLDVFVTGGTSRSDEFDLTITDDEALEQEVAALEADVATLQGQVDGLSTLLAGATRGPDPITGVDTLVFSGLNLQVTNGTGDTERSMNGAGNLIVGYNAGNMSLDRSGSHNLVIGDWNAYSQWSGAVVGVGNSITGEYAVVMGGSDNVASGYWSFVGGGEDTEATNDNAAIVGGAENTASGLASFIGGGEVNTASGIASFVGGGQINTASQIQSSIVGGLRNAVSGQNSFIGGGQDGTVAGSYAAIIGGRTNAVNGNYSLIAVGSNGTTLSNHTLCGWVGSVNVSPC